MMLYLTSEGFPPGLTYWLCTNLNPNSYRLIMGRYNALVGYEFDNPEDLTLIKLKFGV